MTHLLTGLAADERGATAIEYGLIVALIFLAMMGAVQAFGNSAIAMWERTSDTIDTAINDPTPAATAS